MKVARTPNYNNQKVMSRKKKRDASAMDDLRHAMRKMKVRMLFSHVSLW
jgi:hypothetical protein